MVNEESSFEQIQNKVYDILNGEISDITSNMLVNILKTTSDYYNNNGESPITDENYDLLEQMLQNIDPNNNQLSSVGSSVRGGKVTLPFPMGSLDQNYENDTIKWIKDNNWENELFVITDKQDGTSALNQYCGKNNELNISFSRGNGFQGADITRHVKNIPNIPKYMNEPCSVRLEIIMQDKVFENYQNSCQDSGTRVYKNPRNYVAGRMNASESPEWFYENILGIATSVVEPKMGKLEQLQFLENSGYTVTPYIVKKGYELTDEFLIEYLTARRNLSLTSLDGLVIDLDNFDLRSLLRRKSSSLNPMYSRKFKVGSEINVAYPLVKNVHWEPSKSGYLKPRIEIEPTELNGVTITYCTGFNAKFIRDNGIGPGAKIQLTRSGDVIPFVQKVINPSPTGYLLPSEELYGPLLWTKGDVDLYIVDSGNNREVQINKLDAMFSALEIPFLRQTSIEKLYDAGLDDAVKIIKASEQELKDIIGESSGEKIFEGIRKKLNPIDFYILAGSSQLLGRGIGRRKMKKLADAIGIDELLYTNITEEDIIKVEGFDQTTAKTIMENLDNFLQFLYNIDGYYKLNVIKNEPIVGKFLNKTFVFTGFRDNTAKELIENQGGLVKDSVNGDTSYLVTKNPESTSGKNQKALLLGVKIISPTELYALIK